MQKYSPKNKETIRCSNLLYGLIKWFHNDGLYQTCPVDEGLLADQRVFGPAAAKGLIANDGHVWYLTMDGAAWIKSWNTRSAWKEQPSRQFSHYIKIARSRIHVMSKRRAS
jgi:hypothetical protein